MVGCFGAETLASSDKMPIDTGEVRRLLPGQSVVLGNLSMFRKIVRISLFLVGTKIEICHEYTISSH